MPNPAKLATRHRRNSAGGMALQAWDRAGKLTTIHCVYEMVKPLTRDAVVAAVDKRLLQRFPRFRGHVDPTDEYYWVIPERADPQDYVEEVELAHTGSTDEALHAHIASQMRLPLPERRSWQVQILSRRGGGPQLLLWRIAHTLADGVIVAQIMSHVLCEPLGAESAAEPQQEPARERPFAAPPRAKPGVLERLCAFVLGLCFVAALPFWPRDPPTPLQLGPEKWQSLQQQQRQQKKKMQKAAGGGDTGSAGTAEEEDIAAMQVARAPPVSVADAKAAAARLGVTINDLLMTSLASGIRGYVAKAAAATVAPPSQPPPPPPPPPPAGLSVTSVVVVNPRPQAPQGSGGDGATTELLDRYADMHCRAAGCDITLGFLPLPCGAMTEAARLKRVASSTRRLKLSPELPLARWLANCIHACFGVGFVTAFYSYVLAKFTVYASNVVRRHALRSAIDPFDCGRSALPRPSPTQLAARMRNLRSLPTPGLPAVGARLLRQPHLPNLLRHRPARLWHQLQLSVIRRRHHAHLGRLPCRGADAAGTRRLRPCVAPRADRARLKSENERQEFTRENGFVDLVLSMSQKKSKKS